MKIKTDPTFFSTGVCVCVCFNLNQPMNQMEPEK